MKILNLVLLIFVFNAVFYAQDYRNRCGNVFKKAKYPSDSFSIKKRIFELGKTKIIFTLVHHDYLKKDNELCQIWFEQKQKDKILRSQYWGYEEGENFLAIPIRQPLSNYFILNDANEFTGVYYVITQSGKWYEIPGSQIYLSKNKSLLFTNVPNECGGCLIGRFDLNSKKLITKLWNGDGIAWDEIKDKASRINIFENCEFLKWE